MVLSLSAWAEEVQTTAGFNLAQWSSFLRFTLDEAKELVRTHPNRTWVDVPTNEKEDVKNRINMLLSKKDIPEVEDDVIRWRMGICLRAVIKQSKKLVLSGGSSSSAATDIDAIQASTRRFDPIRDI